jgi:cation diffusion facilitator CzcD-associated flavoprotein CzcO
VTVLDIKKGLRSDETADFVVTARGTLNDVFWPDIPGLKNFDGKLMHSAEWDTG